MPTFLKLIQKSLGITSILITKKLSKLAARPKFLLYQNCIFIFYKEICSIINILTSLETDESM